jgi:antitoxin ParD1/3/4
MVLKLSPETEKRIEALVASGRFRDADDVLDSGRLALERDTDEYWAWIEKEDAKADEDVAQGRLTQVEDAFIESLRERVRGTRANTA